MSKLNKKVGLLTLNGYANYGNRLQNYALEQTIASLGFEVETILVSRVATDTFLQRVSKSTIKGATRIIINRVRLYRNRLHVNERKKRFIQFSNKYLHETAFSLSLRNPATNLNEQYDCFVVGSDQIWNPHNLYGTDFYFLPFADKQKRVAYAASFGISELPKDYVEKYESWLDGMNCISVRESEGAQIVESLTGLLPEVLLDPTLLLSKAEWLKISEPAASKPKNKYILTYFLGPLPSGLEAEIQRIADDNSLQIVRLTDLRDTDHYVCGPSEFLDLMQDCHLFLTDSFHGTVFSILFERPFFVFERQGTISMFSRISTLLSLLNLEHRVTHSIEKRDDVFSMDFSCVPPILEAERKRALNYLKEALHFEE